MPKYTIPVIYLMHGNIEVEAGNLEDAIVMAKEQDDEYDRKSRKCDIGCGKLPEGLLEKWSNLLFAGVA
jgi:hypothetical protein